MISFKQYSEAVKLVESYKAQQEKFGKLTRESSLDDLQDDLKSALAGPLVHRICLCIYFFKNDLAKITGKDSRYLTVGDAIENIQYFKRTRNAGKKTYKLLCDHLSSRGLFPS